jgi:hypothetical protein
MRLLIVALGMSIAASAFAQVVVSNSAARDPAQASAFRKTHPCPATGKVQRTCPGWVVDHIMPLCAGGADDPENMQWQTVSDAKKKDRVEAMLCKCLGTVKRGSGAS